MSDKTPINYASVSEEFSIVYGKFKNRTKINDPYVVINGSNIQKKLRNVCNFFQSHATYLSLDASIKNQYAIFTELQRFERLNEAALKNEGGFDEYNGALRDLERAFHVCLIEYEKHSVHTFQDLLTKEGVPNGLPGDYSFYDIVRSLQEFRCDISIEAIPFIVRLSVSCYDMSPEYFEFLSRLQSLEVLEIKLFGEFVPSFEPISKLNKLKHLRVGHCQIADLEPLSALENLKSIEFDQCNHISNISPLAEISSLDTVFFFDTDVSDCSPLLKLEKLVLFSAAKNNEGSRRVQQMVEARREALGMKLASSQY